MARDALWARYAASFPVGRWLGLALVAGVAALWFSVPLLAACGEDDFDCGDKSRGVFALVMVASPLAAVGATLIAGSLARQVSRGARPAQAWRLVGHGIRVLLALGIVAVGLLIVAAVFFAVREADDGDGETYLMIAFVCLPSFLLGWLAMRRLNRLLREWPEATSAAAATGRPRGGG